jgi:hypothetical protein
VLQRCFLLNKKLHFPLGNEKEFVDEIFRIEDDVPRVVFFGFHVEAQIINECLREGFLNNLAFLQDFAKYVDLDFFFKIKGQLFE